MTFDIANRAAQFAARRQKHGTKRALAITLSFVALCVFGITTPVTAQGEVRGQTVYQRPNPDYDAAGIPAGAFVFYPALDLSGEYNDNVFARPVGEVDDFEFIIRPSAELRSRWSRHEVGVRGFAQIHRFVDLDAENNNEYGVSADGRLDLAGGGTLRAQAGFERSTVDRADPEESGRLDPEQVDVIGGSVSFTQQFSRLQATIAGNVTNFDEVDILDVDKDRTDYRGSVRLAYVFSPSLQAFVEPYYQVRDFDLAFDTFGINRDSDVYGGFVGVTYDITGILYGETSVGYYNADFDHPGFSNDNGLSIRSRTTWNVTSLTSIIATVSRENVISNQPGASSRRQTGLDVRVEHALLRNVRVHLDGSYERERYLDLAGRKDKTYEVRVGADYLIDRHFSVFGEYRYTDRSSNLAAAAFSQNTAVIGVRGQI